MRVGAVQNGVGYGTYWGKEGWMDIHRHAVSLETLTCKTKDHGEIHAVRFKLKAPKANLTARGKEQQLYEW